MNSMIAAIISCTLLAIVAFALGYVFGSEAAVHRCRTVASAQCLEWARLSLHGHQAWQLSTAAALRRASDLLLRGGRV